MFLTLFACYPAACHSFKSIIKFVIFAVISKQICLNFGHLAGLSPCQDIPHGSFGPNIPLSRMPFPFTSWKQRIPYTPGATSSNLKATLFFLISSSLILMINKTTCYHPFCIHLISLILPGFGNNSHDTSLLTFFPSTKN